MSHSIRINGREIGAGFPVYLIAELSANHNKSYEKAVQMIRSAKKSGADAVKLQTYTAETLTLKSDKPCFRIQGGTSWDGKTLYDLYQEAYTPWDWQPKLKKVANDLGMDLFSTAFDPTAVDFLEEMDVPVQKIASFEIVDIPLIEKMAKIGKPLIISTGMSNLEEIEAAVNVAQGAGADQIALLKCTSAYPALPEDMNLRCIPMLREQFKVPVGLSDHTMGSHVSVASVALGACIIEKHFTLSRKDVSVDSHFSLEPHEFKALHDGVRETEKALGDGLIRMTRNEEKLRVFRKSLFVVRDLKKGELFTEDNVKVIRPGHGLLPKYLETRVIGKKAVCEIERGTPLSEDMIS